MASSPSTSNPAATLVDSAIAKVMATTEASVEAAIDAAAETDVPALAVPIIKEIFEEVVKEVVEKVGTDLSVGLQTVGTFVVIDTQVTQESNGVSDALAALMVAEKSGNQQAITAAIQAYANANSSLDHDDGSAPPQT